jgi:hypothetical protein
LLSGATDWANSWVLLAVGRPVPMSRNCRIPAELFSQLFPAGVQMTGELLADLEQWARLTSKLAAQDGAAP